MCEEEASKNWQRVDSVITIIVEKMKEDPKFRMLFEDHIATGSYYENLRAMEPNEFDCAFLFKNLHPSPRTFVVRYVK